MTIKQCAHASGWFAVLIGIVVALQTAGDFG